MWLKTFAFERTLHVYIRVFPCLPDMVLIIIIDTDFMFQTFHLEEKYFSIFSVLLKVPCLFVLLSPYP